jgi:hypothetical protein
MAILLSASACSRHPAGAPPAGQAITSLSLQVTVRAMPDGADTSIIEPYIGSPSSLHTATVVMLKKADGNRIRLVDDVRGHPKIQKEADGSYKLTFEYGLENTASLIGHQYSEIADVSAIGTRYDGMLEALGLPLNSAQVIKLVFLVNDRIVLSKETSGAISTNGKNFNYIDVTMPQQS